MITVSIGPFLFSVAIVALLPGVIAAQTTADFMARRGHPGSDVLLWLLLILAVLAARLAYVLQWWPQYRMHPLAMIDVRDGGFMVWVGLGALVIGASLVAWRRRAWRANIGVSVLVGLAVWALVLAGVTRLEQAAHPPMPDMVLHDLDGRPVALASFRGKPMVINLWATWCGPCRREMPVLVAAQDERPDLEFVFADQGESAAQIRRFLHANGLSPRNVLVDGMRRLGEHYNAPGYPVTLFLDAAGQLRERHIGELSRATLAERLEKLDRSNHRSGENP